MGEFKGTSHAFKGWEVHGETELIMVVGVRVCLCVWGGGGGSPGPQGVFLRAGWLARLKEAGNGDWVEGFDAGETQVSIVGGCAAGMAVHLSIAC